MSKIHGEYSQAVFISCVTCTYVRKNLNYRIRNDLNNDHLECLFVDKHEVQHFWSVLGIDPQVLHLIYLANLRLLLLKLTTKIRNYIYLVISTAICYLKQLQLILPV